MLRIHKGGTEVYIIRTIFREPFLWLVNEYKQLKRHMKSHKKTHVEVSAILKKPTVEQNEWFEEKRHEGIYKYNMYLHQHEDQLIRERKPKPQMCCECA